MWRFSLHDKLEPRKMQRAEPLRPMYQLTSSRTGDIRNLHGSDTGKSYIRARPLAVACRLILNDDMDRGETCAQTKLERQKRTKP